jgi:hypothetical protein
MKKTRSKKSRDTVPLKHTAVAAGGRAADPGQVPGEEGGAEGAV